MTYEVQQTRWDRLIRRVSGSIGPGSRVSETISELFPVLDVESVPPELLALMSTRTAWGRVVSPAVVVEFSRCQLFNPADSGKLITISSVWPFSFVNAVVEIGLLEVALANQSAVGQFRDTRFGVSPNAPVGELRSDSNAASTPDIFRVGIVNNLSYLMSDPNEICVLAPGTGLVLTLDNDDQQFHCGFMWRERDAEQAELSF